MLSVKLLLVILLVSKYIFTTVNRLFYGLLIMVTLWPTYWYNTGLPSWCYIYSITNYSGYRIMDNNYELCLVKKYTKITHETLR